MFEDFALRVTFPTSIASTVSRITLHPSSTALTNYCTELSAADLSERSGWLASCIKKLRQLPDGPFAIVPTVGVSGAAIIMVVCPKSLTVKLFKKLAAMKQKLKAKLDKEAVHLHLQLPDLQESVFNVLLTTLKMSGWSTLSNTKVISEDMLSKMPVALYPLVQDGSLESGVLLISYSMLTSFIIFLAECLVHPLPEGQVHSCEYLCMQAISMQSPMEFLLRIQPGVVARHKNNGCMDMSHIMGRSGACT